MLSYVNYGNYVNTTLGPLLFNIYINDIFLFSKNFSNYAHDCLPTNIVARLMVLFKSLRVVRK